MQKCFSDSIKEDMYIKDYRRHQATYIFEEYDNWYRDTRQKQKYLTVIANQLGGNWSGKEQIFDLIP